MQLVASDSTQELLDLEKHIPNLKLDIRYADSANFTGAVVYSDARAFARRPVAEALKEVQDSLARFELGIKVFDAYRPYAATLRFYEVYPDTAFVANPRYGSKHNRGCAIDLTLIRLDDGSELPMPTAFDDFSEAAASDYLYLSPEVIRNRELLIGIMSNFGFSVYASEWWHFDFRGWEQYPLMDLSFEELEGGR
jgi:zinc D-Ala-D-Ala dipeptidase